MRLRAWSASRRSSAGSSRASSPTRSGAADKPSSPNVTPNATPVRRRKGRFSAAAEAIAAALDNGVQAEDEPTPPPPNDPALDLTHHPKVADALFKMADWDALRVLRRTCRAYRTRADQSLARHIFMGYKLKPVPALVVTGPMGLIPGVPYRWGPGITHLTAARVGSSGSSTQKPRRPSAHVLVHTKIVDIRGHITRDQLDHGPRIGHIPVVRFRENSLGYRPKATQEGHTRVVAFVTLDPDTDRGQHLCPVPQSALELVATLRCIPGAPAKMPYLNQEGALRDVTLIFRPVEPGHNRVSRRSDFHQQPEGLVQGLAETITDGFVRGIRYTLVGIEKIDLTNAGFSVLAQFGPVSADYVLRKLVMAIEDILAGLDVPPDFIDEAFNQYLQFKTFDEYRESLPPPIFNLVTVEGEV